MPFLRQENHQRPDFLGILSFTSCSTVLYIKIKSKNIIHLNTDPEAGPHGLIFPS